MHVAETALATTFLVVVAALALLFMHRTDVASLKQQPASTTQLRNSIRMQFCLDHTQTWVELENCYKNV